MTNLIDQLRQSEIFSELSQADLEAIAAFCAEETFDEGSSVLVEGDPADKMFIVTRGKLALEKKVQLGRHSTPRNATIGYVSPNKMAGFSTLTLPYLYSTSAVCVEPTDAIVIDGQKLRDYLQTHPIAGLKVMDVLSELVGRRYRHSINTLTYFLSVVSHELRSPLAAVENYLQVMLAGLGGDLTPKQERMVKRSLLRVTDLRGQIGDVVDLARMRGEQIRADFTWVDLEEFGNEAIEDIRLAAAEKDIRLNVEPPESFEPFVGAQRRLRQTFTNLLNNAIRYSPPGSTVTFRAWYEPDNVFVEVEDEGSGIPEEDIPHIFKEFFRASNIGETPGMGLGLSIAKKTIDAHHGQILVKNLSDGEGGVTGTRFTIIIPRNLKTPEMRRQEWYDEVVDGEQER